MHRQAIAARQKATDAPDIRVLYSSVASVIVRPSALVSVPKIGTFRFPFIATARERRRIERTCKPSQHR